MKTIKYILLFAFLFFMFLSCQKNIDNKKQFSSVVAAQTAAIIQPKICFVQHTEDDLFYTPIDFIYDVNQRLDSLNFAGTPITLKYDNKRRLIRANFGTYAWFDFDYAGNSLLPATLKYYYPSAGKQFVIDSFKYNSAGQMIERVFNNVRLSTYNFTENYTYNKNRNIEKVDIKASNGGTFYNPGYEELVATKYDSRPNFISQNPWIKYVFFHSTFDLSPYLWGALSKNNISDFTWTFDPALDPNSATSIFYYDNQGFANDIVSHWYDPVTNEDFGEYTRASYSSCDIISLNNSNKPELKKSLLQQRLKNIHSSVPLTVRTINSYH